MLTVGLDLIVFTLRFLTWINNPKMMKGVSGVKVAIYGKGGIGKSTTSSNISYVLSKRGYRVMQMGCDPKHDSTKQLLNNSAQVTVLDYISDVPPNQRKMEDIIIKGSNGILCLEAGGPQPGIGCAGRGILTAFDTLDRLGVDDIELDFTVFDVLGDVVCGGFAVPMRQEYADAIYVITSGEYMAIYAANNIFRGMLNFGDRPRAGGIIINRRGIKDEDEIVSKFANAVGVPIVASVPRDPLFQEAESRGRTLCELYPDTDTARCYEKIVDDMELLRSDKKELYTPKPLTDAGLEELIFGRAVSVIGPDTKDGKKNTRHNGLDSCASRGAVYMAGRVLDLHILVHGPRACGYVMSHTQDNHYLSEITENVHAEVKLRNNIRCTDMRDRDCIFGGRQVLEKSLRSMIAEGDKAIMVITTCVSGMIGDDVRNVIEKVKADHPDVDMIPVFADGNLSGSSDAGRHKVTSALIGMIDGSVEPKYNRLNLIDDTFMQYNQGSNQFWLKEVLGRMGMELGVKLFEDCRIEEIRSCRENRFTMMVSDTKVLREMFSAKLDIIDGRIPNGFGETVEWVRRMAPLVGADGDKVIESIKAEYSHALEEFSPFISGKKIVFAVSSFFDVDWIIECLRDAGAEISHVYSFRMGRVSATFKTRYEEELPVTRDLPMDKMIEEIREIGPDMVIGSQHIARIIGCRFASNSSETITHFGSIRYMGYIANILRTPESQGWTEWRSFR